ncbi:helix-turn-helix domain-containing protein [Rhizobium rhizogenes]|uniref:helix-turn-helix domain-containing protein n=1 Tax=Rhizobium rhizogenes TaxID=359 RepID=UPI0022C96AF1|nr:helix-turn-helix domain-containing protein [Rhizobium rhizogenes]MCZ7488197.1 hypothetical protein [Rhizobium rhizogenes]
MNQMVTISYEDQLKAQARARRLRLMGKPKVVNILQEPDACDWNAPETVIHFPGYLQPTRLMVEREPRSHVNLWDEYESARRDPRPAHRFAKMRCIHYGITFKQFQSPSRNRVLAHTRRDIIIETHEAFPHLSSTQLGQLANKDHTTVLHMLGRVKKKSVAMNEWREKQARAE